MKVEHYARALYGAMKDAKGEERDRRFSNFISLLTAQARTHYLRAITESFKKLCAEEARKKVISISSAREMSPEKRQEIISRYRDALGGPETSIVAYMVDHTLVGGFTVRSKDRLVDGSYKRQLLDLYRTFIGATHF